MWNTNNGLRTLEGAEAEFYLEAMQAVVDYLEHYAEMDEELDVFTHDRIFDHASFEQKIVLLYRCLTALLDPTVEAPMLNNVVEAAAYFPFAYVQMRVEEEIELELETLHFADEPEHIRYCYRHLVWQPFSEYLLPRWQDSEADHETESNEPLVYDAHSNDPLFWEQVIDDLADEIFWDRDWRMTAISPQILDGIDPQVGLPADLTDDYITNRLPKVSSEQAREALVAIKGWGKLS